MSDYSKQHVKQMPGKNPGNTSNPGSGSGDTPNHKQHERTIALGEGLEMEAVHSVHSKESVKDAKDNHAPHKAAHAQRNRVISGNSNTMGEGSVNSYTGQGAYHKENPAVVKASHAQREGAIAGNADEEGEVSLTHQHNNTPKNLK